MRPVARIAYWRVRKLTEKWAHQKTTVFPWFWRQQKSDRKVRLLSLFVAEAQAWWPSARSKFLTAKPPLTLPVMTAEPVTLGLANIVRKVARSAGRFCNGRQSPAARLSMTAMMLKPYAA
jgi:hypothetical protein